MTSKGAQDLIDGIRGFHPGPARMFTYAGDIELTDVLLDKYVIALSCIELLGVDESDGVVAVNSALPYASDFVVRRDPFEHYDHDELISGATDNLGSEPYYISIAVDIRTLLSGVEATATIDVTSNVATSWKIDPVGLTGSGLSASHIVHPGFTGASYTIEAAEIAGYSLAVTNSDGGESVRLLPGETKSFTLTYTPEVAGERDLEPITLIAPSVAQVGSETDVGITFRNNGSLDSGPFSYTVHISIDDEITGDDLVLWTGQMPSLPALGESSGYAHVQLPEFPGPRFFGVIADSENQVAEGNETNNTLAAAVTLTTSAYEVVSLGTFPGGSYSVATGVNDHGQIVGHGGTNGTARAFIWDETNGMQQLGTLGGLHSEAYAINNAGQVVVSRFSGNVTRVVVTQWTQQMLSV